MAPEQQIRVDPVFQYLQPPLAEPTRLDLVQANCCRVLERVSPPDLQRLGQGRRCQLEAPGVQFHLPSR